MGRLADLLSEYEEKDILAFHMPGHKRRYKGKDPFFAEFYKRDITEIEGFDDLHDPSGILKELQEEAAGFMGAGDCFYLVNGSTAGVLSSICAAVPKGGRLIIQRDSHMSAYHAMMLQDITPLYVYGEHDSCGICTGLSVEEIKACGKADACFITSPSYEGGILDIRAIAEYVHSVGMKLIVDAAHGAHFCMGGIFPPNALRQGADYEIMSVHKTLAAPTQTALLGLGSGADRDNVAALLDIFQSSSPSYPLMSGIDESISLARGTGVKEQEDWFKLRKSIDESLRDLKSFKTGSMENADPYKLVIKMKGHSGGVRAAEILRERYGIEAEMAMPSYLLLILSMADTKEDYDRLIRALQEMDKEFEAGDVSETGYEMIKPLIRLKPADAFGRGYKKLELKDAVGKISAAMLTAYPPGRALLVPGEEVTEEICLRIEALHEEGVNIRGLDNDMRIKLL